MKNAFKHCALFTTLIFTGGGPAYSQIQPAQSQSSPSYKQAPACQQQAKTALEQNYCQILAKGEGQKLPSFSDFRKNTEKMQRLLLKAPAKRAGVVLAKTTARQVPPKHIATKPATAKTAQQQSSNTVKPIVHKSTSTNTGLSSCTLTAFTIRCANGEYTLQNNKQNYELSIGALDKSNTLVLATRDSRGYKTASDRQYLSAVYPPYIEKMLDIGLADATMSFTKFAATYADHKKHGTNFCGRFYDMYELLKQERKINGVKSRYTHEYPSSISQCMALSSTLIVCDNVTNNWIYRRP